MAEGLSKILKSLKWYMALSPLLLKNSGREGDLAGIQTAMKDRVIELYESLLEYQIKCTIRQFYTLRVVRAVKAIIGLEDWDGKLQDFQKLDEAIRADMKSYNHEAMKFLTAESNELHKDMVDQLRQMNRQRQQDTTGRFNSECKGYMERDNPKPVPGTCQWFRKHKSFEEWIENDSNLLIVSADAGCGKSVLSRYLVESVLPQECPDWFVCHFFFKDNDDQRNLTTGLSCIIHQLLSQTESLSEPAQKTINEASYPFKDWRTLWDILLLLLNEIDKVIILFDAFDEMDRKDFDDLMKKWKEQKPLTSTIGSNTKILVTTRPYYPITQTLQLIQPDALHIQGEKDREIEGIQDEIKLVVQHRMQDLKVDRHFADDTMKALEASFEKKGTDQRTYLWVKLAFELIEQDKSLIDVKSHWTNLLEIISKGHVNAYEELLKRVPSEDKEDVRIVLSIVIAAVSPLTTEQLDIALAVRKRFLSDPGAHPSAQYEDEKKLERRGERMNDWIRNTCRCFVTVYNSKVYFMHQTVKEFLLREPSSEAQPSDDSWHNSITLKQGNATISECWIAYICLMKFPIDDIALSEGYQARYYDPYPISGDFVEVLKYGLHHFRKCQVYSEMVSSNEASAVKVWDVSEKFQLGYHALLDKPLENRSPWLQQMYVWNFPNFSANFFGWRDYALFEAQQFPIFNMMLAAFFGHYNVLVHLVTKYRNLDCADAERIVIAAAMGCNSECLQYLLSQNYPANTSFKIPEHIKNDNTLSGLYSDAFGNTALHWAAIWGNWKMAQMLITNGANPNAHNEKEQCTPISYTIRRSWTRPTGIIRNRIKPLYLGRMSPSQEEVRAGAMSIPSGCYESDWERSLMKLFWENGANLKDGLLNEGMLLEAIICDDENATKFLLQHCGVDPDQAFRQGSFRGYNPLHFALQKGSRHVCLRLLKERANASIICNGKMSSMFDTTFVDNFSTLHIYPEMRFWDEDLLIALLESGGKDVVNVKSTVRNQQGRHLEHWDGATCLHRFVKGSWGQEQRTVASCIEKLVREGANINEPNSAGMTPLHLACNNNYLSQTAMTLLDFGADPTLKDGKGRTPLRMLKYMSDEEEKSLELLEARLKQLSSGTPPPTTP